MSLQTTEIIFDRDGCDPDDYEDSISFDSLDEATDDDRIIVFDSFGMPQKNGVAQADDKITLIVIFDHLDSYHRGKLMQFARTLKQFQDVADASFRDKILNRE
jgi:hypothetical protein